MTISEKSIIVTIKADEGDSGVLKPPERVEPGDFVWIHDCWYRLKHKLLCKSGGVECYNLVLEGSGDESRSYVVPLSRRVMVFCEAKK